MSQAPQCAAPLPPAAFTPPAAQYALLKMATSVAGWPVRKQGHGPPAGWSKGKQRSVAEVSSLICVSCASLPAHGPRAHLPAAGGRARAGRAFAPACALHLRASRGRGPLSAWQSPGHDVKLPGRN